MITSFMSGGGSPQARRARKLITLGGASLLLALGGHANAQSLQAELASAGASGTTTANSRTTGNVAFMSVTGSSGVRQPYAGLNARSPEQAARNFMSQFGDWFGVTSGNELVTTAVNDVRSERVKHVVRFTQERNGYPIVASGATVRLDGRLQVIGVNATLSSAPGPLRASADRKGAANSALGTAAKAYPTYPSQSMEVSDPELVIYNPALTGISEDREILAYQFVVSHPRMPLAEVVLVDAITGAVLVNYTNIQQALDREVHDQENNHLLPLPSGIIDRDEGDPATGDVEVDQAYDYSGATYNFFNNEHGRDSLDDAGYQLLSAVNYCPDAIDCPYVNAFWNGVHMTYGVGLTTDDIVGHELTHGFTEFTSNLIYLNQSGAINESLSDVWGEFVDLLTPASGGDTAADRWLIGEQASIGAIRDMQDPPAYGHPDTTSSALYYCGTLDFGGVHWNSGVNNKAAYLMTDGGTFNGQTVTGLGISKVADLYYHTQTTYLTPGSTYFDLYNSMLMSCSDLGYSTSDCNQVQAALDAVEMDGPICGVDPIPPEYCPAGKTPVFSVFQDFESGSYGPFMINNMAGTNAWPVETTLPYNGSYHVRGENKNIVTDSALETTTGITLPANSYLSFDHLANLENDFDGGVVEYSSDGGSSWQDLVGTQPLDGQSYNNVVNSGFGNPLAGRDAYSGIYEFYRRTIVDLGALAGPNFKVRFRVGTDNIVSAPGWSIDDVAIYQCATTQYCNGLEVTVNLNRGQIPTPNDDVILGTPGPDVIWAGAGNDTVCAKGGDDTVYGESGNDTIFGQAGNDTIYGNDGVTDDPNHYMIAYGGSGDDIIYAEGGGDYLYGQGGKDTLHGSPYFYDVHGVFSTETWGGGNNDFLWAGAEGGWMKGGTGSDFLYGSSVVDYLWGDAQRDTIYGYAGNDEIRGGAGLDNLYGGDNDDLMYGQDGADMMWGQGGNDTLGGGNGNDVLNGGDNIDSCNGGSGADTATASCETQISIPISGKNAEVDPPGLNRRPGSLTEEEVRRIDDCDLTISECLGNDRLSQR